MFGLLMVDVGHSQVVAGVLRINPTSDGVSAPDFEGHVHDLALLLKIKGTW